MLMKPPSILDDLMSQDSQVYTNQTKEKVSRNRVNKKQNTIRIGSNSNETAEKNREADNESVHSNGSKKSRDKKTKETSLNRPKILGETSQYKSEDASSVHSNGSKNSHKSGKKQTTIMKRPKMQSNGVKNRFQNQVKRQTGGSYQPMSFKQAIEESDDSIIRIIDPKEQSPHPLHYRQPQVQAKAQNAGNKKHKFAPFAELQHKNSSDEQVPVYKLQQPYLNRIKDAESVENVNQHKKEVPSKRPIEQSKSVFDESRMNETKSRRRRDIFGKNKEIQNASKISNTIQQSVSGIQDGSRKKSKSRLRQIFNNSRQKKLTEESVMPNQSRVSSLGQIQQSSVYFKPNTGNNDRMVQIQRKVIHDQDDRFGEESSKSGLDLSQSHHLHKNEKDSLIFEFQPQRKKGVTVTSKGIKGADVNKQSQKDMIVLKEDLTSKMVQVKKGANIVSKNQDMIKLNNGNLMSNSFQAHRILKQNQEFLLKSGLIDLSSSKPREVHNRGFELSKLQEREVLQRKLGKNQRPWHEVVPEYQEQVVVIKKVERNEKVINSREKEERQMIARKEREQKELARIEKEQKQLKARKEKEQKDLAARRQAEFQQLKRDKENRQRLRIQQEHKQQQKKRRQKLQQQQKRKAQQRRKQEQQRQNERLIRNQQIQKKKQQQQAIKLKLQQTEKLRKQAEEQQRRKKIQQHNVIASSQRQMSQNDSEKSNKSSKKAKGKKETSLARDKTHKVYVRNQSPRAQESYYESNGSIHEGEQQSKAQIQQREDRFDLVQRKKPKLLNFEDEEIDLKPKSKTDVNFYDFTSSQNSVKAPSSRPPLSKKSTSSLSKSKQKKPKQSTIANNFTKKVEKSAYVKQSDQPARKLTIMELALLKHNESERSCSQESFRSSEDVASRNSRQSVSSKNSKKSHKKESTIGITIKSNKMIGKPPLRQKNSSTSEHQQELQLQRQRQKMLQQNIVKEQLLKQRAIVSKNCTFIDERGRLVQKDLVIKGAQVYGVPVIEQSNTDIRDRMRRSREGRRSRSKSRERRGYGNQTSENEGYYNSSSSSFYQNSTFNRANPNSSQYKGGRGSNNNLILRQFIKPVQQVPNYSRRQEQKAVSKKRGQGFQQQSLNNIYTNKGSQSTVSNNTNQSRSRKSLHRTQRSSSKR